MTEYTFKIFFDNKGEDYKSEEDDLVSEPLINFAKDKKQKFEDFLFYYKGSLVKYDNSLHIKDSIFSQNGDQNPNIIALLLSPGKPTKKPEEKKNLKEDNKIIDKEEVDEENKEEEKKDDNEENKTAKKRKKVNRQYYDDIICPKCKTSAIIERNEDENIFNFNILNCENFHFLKNIKYDAFDDFVFDFNDFSEANLNKIEANHDLLVCSLCSNHKRNLTPPEDQMYICSCGSNICPECIERHKVLGHFKVNIEDRNYFCLQHGERFNYYCFDCNANFCEACKKKKLHDGHSQENFENIKPKREDVINLGKKTKEQKTILLDFIESTRVLFDKILNTIESYLNSYIMVENALIRRYKSGSWNYQLLRNLKNKKLFEIDTFNKLKELNKIENANEKFVKLFKSIYEPIKNAMKLKESKKDKKYHLNKNNSIKITYKGTEDKPLGRKVKLFDPVFVENNKDRLSIKIEEVQALQAKQPEELQVYYLNTTKNPTTNKELNKFTVILTEEDPKIKDNNKPNNKLCVTDMSYMFNNCKFVDSVDFSKWDTTNVTSMEAMFQLCEFENIPWISGFNTQNLENIRAMFCKCTKLKTIPDMSKWFNNKENILNNMSMLFNGCKSLQEITIPKYWYLNRINDISYMFNCCRNLREIHGLKLNTQTIQNMCGLFNGCKMLTSITTSIQFNCQNVKDMSIMFQDCSSLVEISNKFIQINKVENINGLFSGCKKLKTIKYLVLNNMENVNYMAGAFNQCESLENLPDLTKMNLTKVKNIKRLFYGCKNLKIPKWITQLKFKKNTNYDFMVKNSPLDNAQIKKAWKDNEQGDENRIGN